MRVTVTDDSPACDGKFLCDSVAQCVPSAEMLTIGGVMGETTDLGTVTTLGWGWLQGRWDVNPALRHSEEIGYVTSQLCDVITCVKPYYLGNVEDCFHNIEQ